MGKGISRSEVPVIASPSSANSRLVSGLPSRPKSKEPSYSAVRRERKGDTLEDDVADMVVFNYVSGGALF